jgi:deazaflavin-dependent oxidoreductase (nitroreductase family)
MPTPPPFPKPGTFGMKMLNAGTNANVRIYRLSGGRLMNTVKGAPVLLLDHVGRKSGAQRTTPLLYMRDGDDVVVVGSRAGSDATPAWWHNLMANPTVTIQIGRERSQVTARQASPEEKAELWPRLCQVYEDYAVYQQRTKRDIPVAILSPAVI